MQLFTYNLCQWSRTFPPYMWAGLTTDFYKETTNACESFHSHFAQEFYHNHPSIFSFVQVLIQFQISSYIKMRSSSQIWIRNNTTLQKYRTIKEEFLKYQNDPTYRATFVKSLCLILIGNRKKENNLIIFTPEIWATNMRLFSQ